MAIQEHITNWLIYLKHVDPVYGLPIILIGLVMMLMGAQFYRITVPFTFVLIGLVVGQTFFDSSAMRFLGGAGLGIGLAAFSLFAKQYSVALLGGLSGATILYGYLGMFKALQTVPAIGWGAAAFGFVAGTALAFIMFEEMVVFLTALVGASILVSGLSGALPEIAPGLYNALASFLADYPVFVFPFLLGAPTAIGVMIQLSNQTRMATGAE